MIINTTFVYLTTLKMHHYIFALFLQTLFAIEKLLAGFSVQPRIGMNQWLIRLHYHATLLLSSHGYIQQPAPFCTVNGSFFDYFCVETVACDIISATEFIDFF